MVHHTDVFGIHCTADAPNIGNTCITPSARYDIKNAYLKQPSLSRGVLYYLNPG